MIRSLFLPAYPTVPHINSQLAIGVWGNGNKQWKGFPRYPDFFLRKRKWPRNFRWAYEVVGSIVMHVNLLSWVWPLYILPTYVMKSMPMIQTLDWKIEEEKRERKLEFLLAFLMFLLSPEEFPDPGSPGVCSFTILMAFCLFYNSGPLTSQGVS